MKLRQVTMKMNKELRPKETQFMKLIQGEIVWRARKVRGQNPLRAIVEVQVRRDLHDPEEIRFNRVEVGEVLHSNPIEVRHRTDLKVQIL